MVIYHRFDDPEAIDEIRKSGELRGGPPRGFLRSDIPKVKALAGSLPPGKEILPDGRRGYEFTTDVEPDDGGVPGWPTWSGRRDGVRTVGGKAAIDVVIRSKRDRDD